MRRSVIPRPKVIQPSLRIPDLPREPHLLPNQRILAPAPIHPTPDRLTERHVVIPLRRVPRPKRHPRGPQVIRNQILPPRWLRIRRRCVLRCQRPARVIHEHRPRSIRRRRLARRHRGPRAHRLPHPPPLAVVPESRRGPAHHHPRHPVLGIVIQRRPVDPHNVPAVIRTRPAPPVRRRIHRLHRTFRRTRHLRRHPRQAIRSRRRRQHRTIPVPVKHALLRPRPLDRLHQPVQAVMLVILHDRPVDRLRPQVPVVLPARRGPNLGRTSTAWAKRVAELIAVPPNRLCQMLAAKRNMTANTLSPPTRFP